jgi:hypothetical protein
LFAAVVGSACILGIATSAHADSLINARIGSIAAYEANGTGVLVPVTVTCQRGDTFTFDDAVVVQRVPNSSLLVSAFAGRSPFPACTGRAQTVYLVFVGELPLRRGSAATQVGVCVQPGNQDCRDLSAVIQVKQVEFPSEAAHTRGLGVRLSTTATILARGAAVRVTGVMRCTPPREGAGFVDAVLAVVQRDADGVQSAANVPAVAPVCDGRYHRQAAIVFANDRVWHPGQALVEIDGSNCPVGLFTCVAANGVGTVTLG